MWRVPDLVILKVVLVPCGVHVSKLVLICSLRAKRTEIWASVGISMYCIQINFDLSVQISLGSFGAFPIFDF